jgi:hypothetical protein
MDTFHYETFPRVIESKEHKHGSADDREGMVLWKLHIKLQGGRGDSKH